ncbi:MAG: NAD(P)/FAD-dependent oxidoreductase [Nitrospinae bacterium]|nr:NAD(P)/FAD-dependent oxidoreductase [Nitrospinota bacterium]
MEYLIIGCGVAGITAAQNIRKLDATGGITILTEEPYPFYSRIRLIDFLAGALKPESLLLKKPEWYKTNNINMVTGAKAVAVDANTKSVSASDGNQYRYDKLLLATGGISFVPPMAGTDQKGVFSLRTLRDALEIVAYAKEHRRVLIIGGGLLGLEAGHNLIKAGNEVTVAEFFPRLLPRQLDAEGAHVLKTQMEKSGFTFHLGVKSKEIASGANALLLEDGRKIDCDMVLVSAGVRPDMALAKTLGLSAGKAVTVNDRMETSAPDIFAAGDVAEHREVYYGIWPAADKQGETAGINMAGGNATYEGTTMANTLKVAGINMFSAGEIDAEGKWESIVYKDDVSFRKLVIREDRIVGAILYGETNGRQRILSAMAAKTNVSKIIGELKNWNLDPLGS